MIYYWWKIWKQVKSKLLYLVKTCFLNNPVRIIVAISKDVHQLLPTPPGQIFPLLPDIITHSELPLHWCVNNPIQPFVNCTFTKSRGSHRHTLGHRWNYGCDSWCCLWKATCTWHGQSVQEGSKWKAPNIKMVYCSTLLHPRNRGADLLLLWEHLQLQLRVVHQGTKPHEN